MNPTAYQKLLNRATAFLEEADPEQVTIAGCPIPIQADVGQFRRYRDFERTGENWVETGTVVIRWNVLRRNNVTDAPQAGENITVRGKKYRIRSTLPDSIAITVDCVLLS